ncbi:MAG TPA: DUF4331 family protein [Ktedonobacteraceae bacterium]|nr:DUF4331 family protein [Ktedonobacteraceae bacterium]
MADHLDAPGLMSPNMDAEIDITDHYAFQKPGNPDKSILILNVNPLAPTLANSFESGAIYEIKVDTDADAVAEVAFRITFSPNDNGNQTATVRRVTGNAAAGVGTEGHIIIENAPVNFDSSVTITEHGPYKFYAGFRSDPFFFDLVGFLHGFHFTGSDFFIDKNVFSMVLEVPNWALGDNPNVGIWVRTLKATGDANGDADDFFQNDQMGRPAINTVFNHGNDKLTFNTTQPAQMRALFGQSFENTLKSFGYDDAHADAITNILLPDILTYDYSSSAGFLNGRKLTDDVIDIELALVTNGKVTTDMVGPHTDYLDEFPYVGQPHV